MSRNLYVFDCFGVVVSDVSTLFMNKRLNAEQQQFMRREVFRKVDVGQLPFDKMFDVCAERFNFDREQIVREWADYEYVMEDTLRLITKLRNEGHAVALLSNASQDYIDYLFTKFDLYKYFDKMFVSSNFGYAKPDCEFYKICVESFDERFDKAYFTDDNPANLVGLDEFNLTPVLFTTAAEVAQKLGFPLD